VNYLLQRIEAYRGLAILATNVRAAIDTAFLRRLRFIVEFPYPSLADRTRIWQRSLTARTPADPLDFKQLARLNVTGGTIHNAALGATFSAAAADGTVTMSHVVTSLKAEFCKLRKPFNDVDVMPKTAATGQANGQTR